MWRHAIAIILGMGSVDGAWKTLCTVWRRLSLTEHIPQNDPYAIPIFLKMSVIYNYGSYMCRNAHDWHVTR